MWDNRYSESEYAYGTEPNDFLRESVPLIPSGRVLCLAEGEGRNAVFLAQQGFSPTAVDASSVGLQKAEQLAALRSVTIETVHADLSSFDQGIEQWEGIISIFCHLPEPLRQHVYRSSVEALRPGGVFVLEAYTPRQLQYGTGGPPVAEMLYELDNIVNSISGLTIELAREVVRDIQEGKYHCGNSAVLQIVARKPFASG